MGEGSSIFLLESKRNQAGEFLQLSVAQLPLSLPAGWNEKG